MNLPHYPAAVRRLTAVDPNPGMRRLAERRVRRSPIAVDRHVVRNAQALNKSQIERLTDALKREGTPAGVVIRSGGDCINSAIESRYIATTIGPSCATSVVPSH